MTHAVPAHATALSLPTSLGDLRRLFASLAPPGPEQLSGFYQARFIGPWWLRASGRPGVALMGLPQWQGKRFLTRDLATNIIGNGATTRERLTMHCTLTGSALDGRDCAALTYDADAPYPWRWITDELRRLDDGHLLGMTRIGKATLQGMALPFLLTRAG